MHSAGARALREDDNEMSREAVLLQWERKIEVAERLEDDSAEIAQPVPLRPAEDVPRTRRFERSAPEPAEADADAKPAPVAERRTITITGQPTPARRRRAVVDAQLAQPDRIALWAFLLGLLLVAVAAGTAHA
jgi:thiol:disulfide interchange protein